MAPVPVLRHSRSSSNDAPTPETQDEGASSATDDDASEEDELTDHDLEYDNLDDEYEVEFVREPDTSPAGAERDFLAEIERDQAISQGWNDVARLIKESQSTDGTPAWKSKPDHMVSDPSAEQSGKIVYLPEIWTPTITLLLSSEPLHMFLSRTFRDHSGKAVATLDDLGLWVGEALDPDGPSPPLEVTAEDQRTVDALWAERHWMQQYGQFFDLLHRIILTMNDLITDYGVAEIREVTYKHINTTCMRYIHVHEMRINLWNKFVIMNGVKPEGPGPANEVDRSKAGFVDWIVRMREEVQAAQKALEGYGSPKAVPGGSGPSGYAG